jgi:hypothetical protein
MAYRSTYSSGRPSFSFSGGSARRSRFRLFEALVVGSIVVLLFAVGCGSTGGSEKAARDLLIADGVQNVQMTGYAFFGCSDRDTFHDGFTGTKNGIAVEGVVCSGFLKGATIRYTKVGR